MPEEKFKFSTGPHDGQTIKQVVRLHRKSLPESFFSSLGNSILHKMYAFAADWPFARLMVAINKHEKVVGYALVVHNTSEFNRQFALQQGIPALWAMLLSGKIFKLPRLYQSYRYPSKRPAPLPAEAELMDLAVAEYYQGKGLAKKLFNQLWKCLRERGLVSLLIPTADSLPQAHRFYEKKGAELIDSIEIKPGEVTRIYRFYFPTKKKKNIGIQSLSGRHLFAATHIHYSAYKEQENMSVKIGMQYIYKMYEWFVGTSKSIALIAYVNKKPVGVLVGAPYNELPKMQRHRMSTGIVLIATQPRLLLDTALMKIKTILKFQKKPKGSIIDQSVYRIYSLAVLPQYAQHGIAGMLMESAKESAKTYGAEKIIIEVGAKNKASLLFHRMQGFELLPSLSNDTSKVMTLSLE